LLFAGGAGKNEVKVFENNPDGNANFKLLAYIHEFDTACLSMDVDRKGESFAFGC